MARTDAERAAVLLTIRDQLEDRLAQMTASPKVTYNVDGQMFDFNQYQRMLIDAIKNISDLISTVNTSSGRLVSSQVFTGG